MYIAPWYHFIFRFNEIKFTNGRITHALSRCLQFLKLLQTKYTLLEGVLELVEFVSGSYDFEFDESRIRVKTVLTISIVTIRTSICFILVTYQHRIKRITHFLVEVSKHLDKAKTVNKATVQTQSRLAFLYTIIAA